MKLPVPFLTSLNIPHTNFVVFTCAHPKWQNSQSDDGGRSTEEEGKLPGVIMHNPSLVTKKEKKIVRRSPTIYLVVRARFWY